MFLSFSLSLSLSQNVNIVGTISVLLQTLAEHFSPKTVGITQKAIQVRRHFKIWQLDFLLSPLKALIEMCAGNYTNQEVAFKGQIVDSVNIILRSSTTVSLEVCLNRCTIVHISALLITLYYFYHHVLFLAWGTNKGLCINNWTVRSYVGRDTWKQQGFSWGYFTRSWCWCCFVGNERFICKYRIIYI